MTFDSVKRQINLTKHSQTTETPYDVSDSKAVDNFWSEATPHKGVHELRAKRGRPRLNASERKEQIAIRVDADVLAWYREQGAGWQTRMNAVLKAYKDAST